MNFSVVRFVRQMLWFVFRIPSVVLYDGNTYRTRIVRYHDNNVPYALWGFDLPRRLGVDGRGYGRYSEVSWSFAYWCQNATIKFPNEKKPQG